MIASSRVAYYHFVASIVVIALHHSATNGADRYRLVAAKRPVLQTHHLITALEFAKNDNELIVAEYDAARQSTIISALDLDRGTRNELLIANDALVPTLTCNPKGDTIFLAGLTDDGTSITGYNRALRKQYELIDPQKAAGSFMSFCSRASKPAAVFGQDEALLILDLAAEEWKTYKTGLNLMGAVICRDGNTIATTIPSTTNHTKVRVDAFPSFTERDAVSVSGNWKEFRLALSDDGKWLAVGQKDGRVSLRNVSTRVGITELRLSRRATDLSFSPDGSWFAATDGVSLCLVSTDSGQTVERINDMREMRFVLANRGIAIAAHSGESRVDHLTVYRILRAK